MKKLFISADIEGTAGIAHWDETSTGQPGYAHFARQMSLEVAAACEGALRAGYEDILIKDAHGGGRNIDPELLPVEARLFRAQAKDVKIMMAGLDESFDGVVFTGYHSAANSGGNPLSHTMNTKNNYVRINGEDASELMINSLTAAYLGVPVYCVTGDKALCEWMQSVSPNTLTVPVSEGQGNGSVSIHPRLAVERIRETVAQAVARDRASCLFPLPERFEVEICFKEHYLARGGSWYPGARQTGARTVAFEAEDYLDVLKFFYFVL